MSVAQSFRKAAVALLAAQELVILADVPFQNDQVKAVAPRDLFWLNASTLQKTSLGTRVLSNLRRDLFYKREHSPGSLYLEFELCKFCGEGNKLGKGPSSAFI